MGLAAFNKLLKEAERSGCQPLDYIQDRSQSAPLKWLCSLLTYRKGQREILEQGEARAENDTCPSPILICAQTALCAF